MIRSYALPLLLLSLVLLGGCGDPRKESGKADTIAYSVEDAGSPQNIRRINQIRSIAGDLNSSFVYESCDFDLARQISSIEHFVERNVDYIIITPVSLFGLEESIEKAFLAGIRVLLLGSRTRVHDPKHTFAVLVDDHESQGMLSAEAFSRYFKGDEAAIVEFQGVLISSVTRDKALGFRKKLGEYENLEIAGVRQNIRSRIEAYDEMRDAITMYGGNIDAVFAHSDVIGLGVLDAFLEFDIEAPILSIGGTAEAAKAILSTGYYASVGGYDEMGEIRKALQGKALSREESGKSMGNPRLYTAENAGDLLP